MSLDELQFEFLIDDTTINSPRECTPTSSNLLLSVLQEDHSENSKQHPRRKQIFSKDKFLSVCLFILVPWLGRDCFCYATRASVRVRD